MHASILFSFASALLVLVDACSARSAEIDPGACFCIRHASGQFQRGCEAVQFSSQPKTIAKCRDPESDKRCPPAPITESWTVVVEGDEGCEVCRLSGRETTYVPRGEDEDQDKASE